MSPLRVYPELGRCDATIRLCRMLPFDLCEGRRKGREGGREEGERGREERMKRREGKEEGREGRRGRDGGGGERDERERGWVEMEDEMRELMNKYLHHAVMIDVHI